MRAVKGAARRRPRRGGLAAGLRRLAWRAGVPIVLIGTIFGAVVLTLPHFGRPGIANLGATLVEASAALGFRVADIRVEGRETTDRATVLEALGAGVGTPILAVDPKRAKEKLEALPWVRSAAIERRLPDTLYVRLVERKPLALWQHGGKLQLIDRAGEVIPVTRLERFAKLPLVVGADAARHAAELLRMLASEPDLAGRVSAAVRVGDRRWNLRIDGAVDVLLPAEDAPSAWAELARLERSSALFERKLRAVDMRLPDRLVLQVVPEAPKEALPPKKGRPSAKNT
jgi:cell division protein FtsQ